MSIHSFFVALFQPWVRSLWPQHFLITLPPHLSFFFQKHVLSKHSFSDGNQSMPSHWHLCPYDIYLYFLLSLTILPCPSLSNYKLSNSISFLKLSLKKLVIVRNGRDLYHVSPISFSVTIWTKHKWHHV